MVLVDLVGAEMGIIPRLVPAHEMRSDNRSAQVTPARGAGAQMLEIHDATVPAGAQRGKLVQAQVTAAKTHSAKLITTKDVVRRCIITPTSPNTRPGQDTPA